MKILILTLTILIISSCSNIQTKEKNPDKTQDQQVAKNLSGKWIAEGKENTKWVLELLEGIHLRPIDIEHLGGSELNSNIVGLLKVMPLNPSKKSAIIGQWIYNLTGSRVEKNRVVLSHSDYLMNHPLITRVLLFKLPNSKNKKKITAWFEYSRTGIFPNRKTKVSDKHRITKLVFKKVKTY